MHPGSFHSPLHDLRPVQDRSFTRLLRVLQTVSQQVQALLGHGLHEHDVQVACLAFDLAEAVGMVDHLHTAEQVFTAGLLHDLGKSTVRPEVLNKPGPLTDRERDEVMLHPVQGLKLAQELHITDHVILGAILSHHEKYDGSGYPVGLSGEAIPLLARIVSIADVYHAMTSDRPYRKALPHEVACAYLSEQRGRHFDPELVDVFLRERHGRSS